MDLEKVNRLVAEKVMGYEIHYAIPNDYHLPIWVDGDVALTDHPFEWIRWDPTHNISQAWMVVERLVEDPFKLASVILQVRENFTHCDFWSSDHDLVADATADTSPLAICLAALKTVGVEVEG